MSCQSSDDCIATKLAYYEINETIINENEKN